MRKLFTVLSVATLALGACRQQSNPGGTGGGGGGGGGGGMMMTTCPGETLNLCDLQLTTSPRHPAIDDPIQIVGVEVVTATHTVSANMGTVTTAGFYVRDKAVATALDGRYSGILVTYGPNNIVGDIPRAGDIVTLDGAYNEFGPDGFPKQKQIKASRITRTGNGAIVAPITIAQVASIGRGGAQTAAYEGVLLRIEAVSVSSVDVTVNGMPVFGAFEVENSLIVSGKHYEHRNPQLQEVFTAITGVLRLGTAPFEAGQYLLTPRMEADVVPQNQAVVVRTMANVQDPSSAGYPTERCVNTNGQTTGKCAVAELNGVVVTAVNGYVSANLRQLFVQDPNDVDGQFGGVKVVYNRNRTQYVPQVGHIINVRGEVIEYFGGTQIQYPEMSRVGTQTASITPTVVLPADIARKNPASTKYEGVLVRLENVSVETFCLEDSRGRDHGNWIVTGDVMIGSSFSYDYNGMLRPAMVACLDANEMPTGLCGCNTPAGGTSRPGDQRKNGDRFVSITGVIDYSFGDYQLQVRGNGDLVRP